MDNTTLIGAAVSGLFVLLQTFIVSRSKADSVENKNSHNQHARNLEEIKGLCAVMREEQNKLATTVTSLKESQQATEIRVEKDRTATAELQFKILEMMNETNKSHTQMLKEMEKMSQILDSLLISKRVEEELKNRGNK